jgi:hypothetical protein
MTNESIAEPGDFMRGIIYPTERIPCTGSLVLGSLTEKSISNIDISTREMQWLVAFSLAKGLKAI